MQRGGGGRAARQHERAQRMELLVERIDGVLERFYLRRRDAQNRARLFVRLARIESPTDAASRSATKRRRPLWFGLNRPCGRALPAGPAQFAAQDPSSSRGSMTGGDEAGRDAPDLLDLGDRRHIHAEGEVMEAVASLPYMSDARPSEVIRQYGDAVGGQHVEHPNAALGRLR